MRLARPSIDAVVPTSSSPVRPESLFRSASNLQAASAVMTLIDTDEAETGTKALRRLHAQSKGCRLMMVSVRSGPVEMMSTGTPARDSILAR